MYSDLSDYHRNWRLNDQADERVRLSDLKATQERNAAAARAAELRNMPAFSDVNFDRPQQAPQQAGPAPAPQESPMAQADRGNQMRTPQPAYANQSEAETRRLTANRPVAQVSNAPGLQLRTPGGWAPPAMNEKQRLDEMRRLNPVEPQANQTPAEDARISRQAPVGQTSGSSFVDRIRHAESRGNMNAVGPNVPGQGTAKSDMQVMDKTNMDPGFGVRPAQNNSLEERSRVGREYAQAMLNRYGNEAEAAAAYNWGPGNYDRWKAAGANPAQMPAETRNYVAQVAGGGAAPQQGQPQQTAQGAPQQQAPQYQPNPQMKALVEQHIGELAARYQQIQRLAQNTLDPMEVDKLRLAAMDVQAKVRDMRILGAVSMGYMSHADAAQMSPTIAAMLQKQAEAQSKAAGEIAVENVRGSNTLQNTTLKGLMDQQAAAAAPVRLQPVTNQFNGNQGSFNPATGAYQPFAAAPNSVLPQ